MVRIVQQQRLIKGAMALGFLALLANLTCSFTGMETWLRIGDLFLFIAAGALGLQGAVIATAFGVVPETLITGESILALQSLILVCSVAWAGERITKMPLFVAGLVSWAVLVAPMLAVLASAGAQFITPITPGYLLVQGFGYAVLLLTAGCILSNSTVLRLLGRNTRQVRFPILLVNAIPLVTLLVMLASSILMSGATEFLSASWIDQNLLAFTGMLAVAIVLPAIIGWRATDVIARNLQEVLSRGALTTIGSPSFSGLSSDFWRKHSFQDVTSSRHGLGGADNNDAPKAINSQLSAPDQGICALNRNGTITFLNRKFRALCEIHSNDVIGKRLDAIEINREICREVLNLLEESFTKGPRLVELKINRLPDQLKYLEISTLRSESFENSSVISGPDSIIVRIRDITHKRAIESHLLQSQKLTSLGSIVSGIAHSFNDSLTAITAQASLAAQSSDLEAVRSALTAITETAQRAGSSVRDLLDFAHGKPGLLRTENLESYLTNKLPLIQKACGARCQVVLKASGRPLGASVDKSLLLQALTAVVLNAAESLPQEGAAPIEISLDEEVIESAISVLHPGAQPGRYARIRVKDQGAGMTSEVLSRACDPLFTTKSSSGHSGLGLSIAFTILRAHDGFITIESQPQRGTTISLYVPLKELPERTTPTSSEREVLPCPRGHEEKVLVVDDNDAVRSSLIGMLTSLGYRAEACGKPEEVVELCRGDKFDLLLVDMLLPTIPGEELALKVQESAPKTKILKMTAGSHDQRETLHKPFDMNELAVSIRARLDS